MTDLQKEAFKSDLRVLGNPQPLNPHYNLGHSRLVVIEDRRRVGTRRNVGSVSEAAECLVIISERSFGCSPYPDQRSTRPSKIIAISQIGTIATGDILPGLSAGRTPRDGGRRHTASGGDPMTSGRWSLLPAETARDMSASCRTRAEGPTPFALVSGNDRFSLVPQSTCLSSSFVR